MDKKSKKQLAVLRGKIQRTEQLLGAAKRQTDDPAEVTRLEKELQALHTEVEKLQVK
ncbi:hypothetical protein [Stratiformator vulcanicus]|uniref:Uncharacterized protein n=1 Tax=Stratiformator vulcanicus TaxID=2527980 RepID=A0A517R537_9PLAN|nr:hypothetical protein [Stratiformator vulcanicus]QDT39007.1 hypothetical protein Pan189_34080 [Stratiformator vulcanicus]